MKRLWVGWTKRDATGGSLVAHAADIAVRPGDVRNGDFPLVCGLFAPSGFDADVEQSTKRHCRDCEYVLETVVES